jgi:hypothetical protein
MLNVKLNRVSLRYKRLPASRVVAFLGWVIICLADNPAFPNPPVPLVPPNPPDPTRPVDLATRMNALQSKITAALDGGKIATSEKNAALAFAFEGLDANAFYVQLMTRTNLPGLLTSGYLAMSKNRSQSQLETPAITGIEHNMSRQLEVRLTSIANAMGYEVQTLTGTGEWTTVKFSPQARSIILPGLTPGTVVQVRARALGGSTGESGWSMPGSCMVV